MHSQQVERGSLEPLSAREPSLLRRRLYVCCACDRVTARYWCGPALPWWHASIERACRATRAVPHALKVLRARAACRSIKESHEIGAPSHMYLRTCSGKPAARSATRDSQQAIGSRHASHRRTRSLVPAHHEAERGAVAAAEADTVPERGITRLRLAAGGVVLANDGWWLGSANCLVPHTDPAVARLGGRECDAS